MASESTPVDFTKPLNPTVLKGRTALITGGASGIGAGIVRALAEAGASVIIADINAQVGEKNLSILKSLGHSVRFVQTDVTDWDSQLAAFKLAIQGSENGNIDIVIACAGVGGVSCLMDTPFNAQDPSKDPEPPRGQLKMIDVNLVGTMHTTTLAAHYWRRRGVHVMDDNQLIVVASNIAYFPSSGFPGYSASKMGVRALWKSLRNVPVFAGLFRMNLLAPHIVRSPMTAGLQPILDKQGIPVVEVQDCVACLLRFCCDKSIRSRAVQVNPRGSWFDLCDDLEGFDGSKAFQEHHETETKAVFDLIAPDMTMN